MSYKVDAHNKLASIALLENVCELDIRSLT